MSTQRSHFWDFRRLVSHCRRPGVKGQLAMHILHPMHSSGLTRRTLFAEVASEAARVEGRPLEISARLVELQRELSAIRDQWTSAERSGESESISRRAAMLLLKAREEQLENELEMLQYEQRS